MPAAAFFDSFSESPSVAWNGVLIGPGLTAFTRMPRGASSAASDRTRDRTAALVAARIESPAGPTLLRKDVLKTTVPHFLRSGAAFCAVKKAP